MIYLLFINHIYGVFMTRPAGSKNRTPAEILHDANIQKVKATLKVMEAKKLENLRKKVEEQKSAAKKKL